LKVAHQSSYSKRRPPEVGSINEYFSSSKIYSAQIKLLGYPDINPCECTLKKSDRLLWTKKLPSYPGLVNISDNGKYLVFANWGWYDEGGFVLISTFEYKRHNLEVLYLNNQGNVLWKTKIEKGHYWNKDLLWLSKDGLNFRIHDKNKWLNYENNNNIINRIINQSGELVPSAN